MTFQKDRLFSLGTKCWDWYVVPVPGTIPILTHPDAILTFDSGFPKRIHRFEGFIELACVRLPPRV